MTSTAENRTIVDGFIQAFTEHAQVAALQLLLASDRMLIPVPGHKACRYREQR